jgi:CO/xanthine dehydrogenase Mo-binding subunit
MTTVGRSVVREDAVAKVTGRARFAADLEFPRMLHAKAARIPAAHAKIRGIDIDEVLRLPDVVAVLTPGDLRHRFGDEKWVPVLASEKVRSYADAVAVVSAETERAAIEAVGRVKVDYEELQAVFDVEEAAKPGAPLLYEGSNVFRTDRIRKGDIVRGFDEADIILQRRYSVPFAEHAFIEPETAIGVPEPDGRISVFGSIKQPFDVRRMVAGILGVALDRVRIVPVTLGGHFGGKDEDMALMASRVALLARKTGRPVRISNSREESILEGTKRHRFVMNYRVGVRLDGRLTAMDIRCLADAGAYVVKTPLVTFRSCTEATGPYVVPNVNVEVRSVLTNNNDSGAFRGFGSPQVDFACESMMDELAQELDMDPYEFRRMNAFEKGCRTANGQLLNGSVTVRECMDKAVSSIPWQRLRSEGSEGAIRRGIGMAASFRGISLGAASLDTAGAIVSIQEDSRVLLTTGIREGGQGARTVLSQICAETLGVAPDQVSFLDWDTSSVPDSGPTVASRGTLVGGNATRQACRQLLEEIFSVVSRSWGVGSAELVSSGGKIASKNNPSLQVSFKEAVGECRKRGKKLISVGWYQTPPTGIDPETGQGVPFFDYVYGADVAEVEVDMMTGSVRVTNFVSVHDVGKAIHPELVAGQIYGGVCMGVGTALYEEYGLKDGQPKMLNLDQYFIPTSMDIGEIKAVLLEEGVEEGPFGAVCIGEIATQLVAPAIINAIAHATGKRIYDLPANLERIFPGRGPEKKMRTKDGVTEA